MSDLRNQCKHYYGEEDCGQGDKCSEDCFEQIALPNKIFIQWPGNIFRLRRFNDTDIEYVRVPTQKITIEDIMEIVCAYYKVTPTLLARKSHKRRFSYPRKMYAMLCRDYTTATYAEIGGLINRTPATVQYAKNTWMKYKIQQEYDQLRIKVEQRENVFKLRQAYGGEHGESRDGLKYE